MKKASLLSPPSLPGDDDLVDLFYRRDESALSLTEKKYGSFLKTIAYRILNDEEDSKECLNDALLRAWNKIPPAHPDSLRSFLAVIVRRTALDRFDKKTAAKRVNSDYTEALDDLAEILPGDDEPEEAAEARCLKEAFDRYLAACTERKRYIFMARYCYSLPIREIAGKLSLSVSSVNKELSRIKEELRAMLESEEFEL